MSNVPTSNTGFVKVQCSTGSGTVLPKLMTQILSISTNHVLIIWGITFENTSPGVQFIQQEKGSFQNTFSYASLVIPQ